MDRQGRYLIPARAIGSAERLLQMAIDYAKNRHSMGDPIAEYQAIQWKIADSHVGHRSRPSGSPCTPPGGSDGLTRHASSIAKLTAPSWPPVVDRVMQIHGGMGYTRELPDRALVSRVRLRRIFEGTDEIQRRTIARNLIKGHVQLGGIGE